MRWLISFFFFNVVEYKSPLVQAVDDDDIEKVKGLLTKDNVNEKSRGVCSLQVAIKNQNIEMVKLLLDTGADINLANNLGEYPSHSYNFVYSN